MLLMIDLSLTRIPFPFGLTNFGPGWLKRGKTQFRILPHCVDFLCQMTHILGKSPLARYRAWYAMNEMLKQITARSFIVTHKLCIDMCTTVSYYNTNVDVVFSLSWLVQINIRKHRLARGSLFYILWIPLKIIYRIMFSKDNKHTSTLWGKF